MFVWGSFFGAEIASISRQKIVKVFSRTPLTSTGGGVLCFGYEIKGISKRGNMNTQKESLATLVEQFTNARHIFNNRTIGPKTESASNQMELIINKAFQRGMLNEFLTEVNR